MRSCTARNAGSQHRATRSGGRRWRTGRCQGFQKNRLWRPPSKRASSYRYQSDRPTTGRAGVRAACKAGACRHWPCALPGRVTVGDGGWWLILVVGTSASAATSPRASGNGGGCWRRQPVPWVRACPRAAAPASRSRVQWRSSRAKFMRRAVAAVVMATVAAPSARRASGQLRRSWCCTRPPGAAPAPVGRRAWRVAAAGRGRR